MLCFLVQEKTGVGNQRSKANDKYNSNSNNNENEFSSHESVIVIHISHVG